MTGGATLHRVRWWRAGWKGGAASANVRYYQSGAAADRFARRLRTNPPNDFGAMHVEVTWCTRGAWEGGVA